MSKLRRWVTRKDRKAYQRIVSGFLYHQFEHVRFLTLTNKSDESGKPLIPLSSQVKKLELLIRWIRKTYGNVEYFSVHTDEGNGVFHLLITGPYLPVVELRKKWVDLTGAWRVNIQLVVREDGMPSKKMFGEMTRQCDVIRYSCSKGWQKPGSVQVWKSIISVMYQKPISFDGHDYVLKIGGAIECFQDWVKSDRTKPPLLTWHWIARYMCGVIRYDVQEVKVYVSSPVRV